MKRLFYLSVGMAAGAYASHRLGRAARAWTPNGLADSATGLGVSVRRALDDVRANSVQREAELRAALGSEDRPDTVPRIDDRRARG